jgi:hypothetical protein
VLERAGLIVVDWLEYCRQLWEQSCELKLPELELREKKHARKQRKG